MWKAKGLKLQVQKNSSVESPSLSLICESRSSKSPNQSPECPSASPESPGPKSPCLESPRTKSPGHKIPSAESLGLSQIPEGPSS